MSRQQLMNMYQRQVALGGQGGMSSGGIFSADAKIGLQEYRDWHAMYKLEHPYATRDQLKVAWRAHKARLGEPMPRGRALVGGYSDMTPMRGMARPSMGVRHCAPGAEMMEPSGVRRCTKYMPGPRSAMHGSALVGGFPGEVKLFKAWREANRACDIKQARAAAKAAYEAKSPGDRDFRAGVAAAAQALGLPGFDASRIRAPRIRTLSRRASPGAAQSLAALESILGAPEQQEGFEI